MPVLGNLYNFYQGDWHSAHGMWGNVPTFNVAAWVDTSTLPHFYHLTNISIRGMEYRREIGNDPANLEAPYIDRQLLVTDLARLIDLAILKQSLSLKSVILTASSFSHLSRVARSRPELQQLNQIGAGL
jgi:hypothetical protein